MEYYTGGWTDGSDGYRWGGRQWRPRSKLNRNARRLMNFKVRFFKKKFETVPNLIKKFAKCENSKSEAKGA